MYKGFKEKLLIDLNDRTLYRFEHKLQDIHSIKEQIDKLKNIVNNIPESMYDEVESLHKEIKLKLLSKYKNTEYDYANPASTYNFYLDMKNFCDSLKKIDTFINSFEMMRYNIPDINNKEICVIYNIIIKKIDRCINGLTLSRDLEDVYSLFRYVIRQDISEQTKFIVRGVYYTLKNMYA